MANEVIEKIKNAVNNLVTLEIITAVGDVMLKDGKVSPVIDYSKNPNVMLTRVDLLQGDITTVFHEEFVTGKYQSLRDFHAGREKEGYEMIKANIAALERLWDFAQKSLGT
ncbi:MAG: hypothetical protein E3K32_11585 [wastewater metagenome]|nr:hypothetical protein [Candidatus Loosdrechtia aerotolerans]